MSAELRHAGAELLKRNPEAFYWLLGRMKRVAKAKGSRRDRMVDDIRAEAEARFGIKAVQQ